jgi:hypothetical protein
VQLGSNCQVPYCRGLFLLIVRFRRPTALGSRVQDRGHMRVGYTQATVINYTDGIQICLIFKDRTIAIRKIGGASRLTTYLSRRCPIRTRAGIGQLGGCVCFVEGVVSPPAGPLVVTTCEVWNTVAHNFGCQAPKLLGLPVAAAQAYLLGLLAKIKCSICSNQLNL